MLARAQSETSDAAITYEQADLDVYGFKGKKYDMVVSQLALHYFVNLSSLVRQVYDSLAPGGRFVVSVEHPIYTAPTNPKWSTNGEGRSTWPVDSYLGEGPRTTNWLADGVVKQHRTIGTYLKIFLGAGFVLEALEEWAPSKEQIEAEERFE